MPRSGRRRSISRGIARTIRLLAVLAAATPGVAGATTATCSGWGNSPGGEPVSLCRVRAGDIELSVSDYGARMVTLRAPDRDGHVADILIAPDRAEALTGLMAVAGATIGRYANRIAGGRFVLDGAEYRLPVNNGGNTLHGGPAGFNTRRWAVRTVPDGVRFTLRSPDGDMGFPGALTVHVTYTLRRIRNGARVRIAYDAATTRPTVLNFTNHAFFNLSGDRARAVLDHVATIAADAFTPTGADGIPVGTMEPLAGTAFDFGRPRRMGDGLPSKGIDANLVLRRPGLGTIAARIDDPVSGRALTVRTTEPAIQVFLPRKGDETPVGFSLETQHFPDAPNHSAFPSTVLRPGQRFRSITWYDLTRPAS